MDIEAITRSRDLSRQVNKELQQIIDEADKTSIAKLETTYQSVLNQPSLIAISSTSALQPTAYTSSVAETSFNSFTVNLPRPAINVKSLQLLSMNAPQAQVNIPDNALCFWYYKLATQNNIWREWSAEITYQVGDKVSIFNANVVEGYQIWNSWQAVEINTASPPALDNGDWIPISTFKYESPNIFNLHCVRLLPSYYKDELIPPFQTYGYNRTFTSYEDLATELQKATTTVDLSIVNGASPYLQALGNLNDYTPATIPNDVSITYNATKNKFIFQGLNTNTYDDTLIPEWNQFTLYPVQSLIRYTPEGQEEQVFVNYSPEQTYPPDNLTPTTSWQIYTYDNTTIWNTYLLAGYNDPNVIKMQGEQTTLDWNPDHLFQPGSKAVYYKGVYWTNTYLSINQPPPPNGIWSPTVYYNEGDIVYLDVGDPDGVYYCVGPNINYNPTGGSDYWVEIQAWNNPWQPYNNPTYDNQTGLNFISKNYDFKDNFQATRVLGIPGQPYTQNFNQLQQIVNNQTLNRILGFTWSGANMVTPFNQIPDKLAFGSLITLFINRLRPVPTYAQQAQVGEELGTPYDEPPTVVWPPILYYTADAFCNLVYSSTITVYTRILGGSTVDTVRNTNLLAIMPLNCGNLGVTFSTNFIDNPLTKVDNDIYSIEFEFRTDNDQPYWFSNNSVVTLQLKLTYE